MKRRSFLGCGVVAKRYRGFALLVVTRPIRWSASIDASWGLSAGLVGNAYSHSDCGGYTSLLGNVRSEELMQRWCELALRR